MSDSHDNLTNIQKAIGFFLNEGVEKIIHCGDMVAPFIGRAMQALKGTEIETVAIYGNNDGERDAFHSMMGDFVNFHGIFSMIAIGMIVILLCIMGLWIKFSIVLLIPNIMK